MIEVAIGMITGALVALLCCFMIARAVRPVIVQNPIQFAGLVPQQIAPAPMAADPEVETPENVVPLVQPVHHSLITDQEAIRNERLLKLMTDRSRCCNFSTEPQTEGFLVCSICGHLPTCPDADDEHRDWDERLTQWQAENRPV